MPANVRHLDVKDQQMVKICRDLITGDLTVCGFIYIVADALQILANALAVCKVVLKQ